MDFGARLRIKPGMTTERIGDEVVVFDPDDGMVHHLNETAAAVLDACNGARMVDEIVIAIAEQFALTDDDVRVEVMDMLARLEEAGLVTASGPAAPRDP